ERHGAIISAANLFPSYNYSEKKARPKSTSLVSSLVSGATSSTNSSSEEEIVDGANQSSASTPSATASQPKQSWIWTHFDESKDPNYTVCQKDCTRSTKTFHEHLRQIHNLKDWKRTKLWDSMDTYLKTSKLVKQPELTVKSFKSTIVLFLLQNETCHFPQSKKSCSSAFLSY
ncbi:uncharacterized protein VP01_5195g1, partial [Puccinia sorghi]